MSAERTEQPTQRKLRKSREQGQFPAAKELVGALQFLILVLIISRSSVIWFESAQAGFRAFLIQAFRPEWAAADLIQYLRSLILGCVTPLAIPAGIILGLTLAFQLGATNMGFALTRLAPDLKRLNPLDRVKDLGRQNIPQAIQAVLMLAVLAWAMYSIVREQLPALLRLPLTSVPAGVAAIGDSASAVLWRSTLILMIFGAIEGLRQRAKYKQMLMMTKQEVRDEMKESEGDQHVKARLRRLRRELLRRRMIQAVPDATAVIVNPTHYAVAIRYEPSSMAAPKVVAKGRNYLAARIRQVALENNVMIVENPPLARALYGSVEVGQDIPSDFYRAVAEILAYVYRMAGYRTIPG